MFQKYIWKISVLTFWTSWCPLTFIDYYCQWSFLYPKIWRAIEQSFHQLSITLLCWRHKNVTLKIKELCYLEAQIYSKKFAPPLNPFQVSFFNLSYLFTRWVTHFLRMELLNNLFSPCICTAIEEEWEWIQDKDLNIGVA